MSGREKAFFDRRGLLSKISFYDGTGKLRSEETFIWDKQQHVEKQLSVDYEYNKTATENYYRTYQGNLLVKDSLSSTSVTCEYEYNGQGRLIKKLNYQHHPNSHKILSNKIEYLLDGTGKTARVIETSYQGPTPAQGTIISDKTIEYDSLGKVIKKIEAIDLELNEGTISYKYDSKGNLIEVTRQRAASYTFTYNKLGLPAKQLMDLELDGIHYPGYEEWNYSYWK